MKSKILILALVILGFTGCVTQKRCQEKFPPRESISVRDSIVIRDTVIYIPEVQYVIVPDTIIDTVLIKPVYDDGGLISDTLYLVSKLSWARAWVKDYELFGTISDKDTTLVVKPTESQKVVKQTEKYKTIEKTEIVEVRYIPKFYKFCFWWWLGSTIVILLFVAYKIFKPQINVYNR